MAGLVKAKKYDWKDSNLALFGSDTEKQVKKASAQTEPAWKHAGEKIGLQIWRIVKFKVTHWDKDQYGQFYNGDSYIILNTYKDELSDALLFDVHFWIGQYSTQDEYCTAAYKTVELDTLLDDVPVQHREVQGFESSLFKSYFKSITYLEGGADSGFQRVKPEEYKPRLFHFHGNRTQVTVKQIPRARELLDSTDLYILDLGLQIYQWNGSGCNKDEKFKAMQYVAEVKSKRGGKPKVDVLEEEDIEDTHDFYRQLDETPDADVDEGEKTATQAPKKLFRLSDASGNMKFTLEKNEKVEMSDFDTKDVFILDTFKELFVWIGKQTTKGEQQNAMAYAHRYLQKHSNPLMSVSCLKEGRENKFFLQAVAA